MVGRVGHKSQVILHRIILFLCQRKLKTSMASVSVTSVAVLALGSSVNTPVGLVPFALFHAHARLFPGLPCMHQCSMHFGMLVLAILGVLELSWLMRFGLQCVYTPLPI